MSTASLAQDTRTATVTAPVKELSSAGFFVMIGIAAARQGILPKGYDPSRVRRMMADAEAFNCRTLEAVALVAAQQAADRGDGAAARMLAAIGAGASNATTHEQAVAAAVARLETTPDMLSQQLGC